MTLSAASGIPVLPGNSMNYVSEKKVDSTVREYVSTGYIPEIAILSVAISVILIFFLVLSYQKKSA